MNKFSTVEGLKRVAKRMKREQGITHVQALNRVAQEAGYRDFDHARASLLAGDNA